MKAAPFEYSRPVDVAEACALLASDENARVIAGVRFPVWSGRVGSAFHEVNARRSDFAFAAAAAQIELAADGTCTRIALGIGGVSDIPVRLDEAEEALIDTPLEPDAIRDIVR